MSPKLRPLHLPVLVEQRRKFEESLYDSDSDMYREFDVLDSSSDTVSPLTPTFSRGHLRYSSSTSSFELTTPASPEPPSSPSQPSHKSSKYSLPDVEEEPVEHCDPGDDLDTFDSSAFDDDLYDCLCDEPCLHRDHGIAHSATGFYSHNGQVGYDFGFLSDGDLNTTLKFSRKPRAGIESPLAGFTQRVGSKFAGITNWNRRRQASITQSPVSDFGFEQRPALSRAASSRSSSLSASGHYQPDRTNEPPLPPTPALSFYESSDSIALPAAVDIEKATHIDPTDIERDRALATTPLLPPFMNDALSAPVTAQASPLVSPKVALFPEFEPQSPLVLSPPLSTKPSVSSFSRVVMSGELPGMQEQDEKWCNLLGHANYTIQPAPYKPEMVNLDTLHQLRAAWVTARINYTKHLARTGEHYGITSKTYSLTETKWAETKALWRNNHDEVAKFIVASGAADTLPKFNEDVLTAVPHMDTEGKFPERGDEDIVGPMVRDAVMLVPGDERKNYNFWRTLAGRVGLRK
ncbi:hypothetical protein BKA67DRAFT_532809 [Truncatella angustata]|uniref:Only prolin and serin are matching in the corresponding protein n=1 Tax=Truncatella angustata TaxID=152316 RepID=A0A9P8URE5_9PEZI|nr:uncharacterized protein BKA67DRAFT_532809 [Truncatella angustata]KAH6657610.1 hypothetical protein BKA67DRAFT_532809 [Truncatella angustata]KAH8204539.1 hypothetical protein TruAng_001313 [Truncatella angustata]